MRPLAPALIQVLTRATLMKELKLTRNALSLICLTEGSAPWATGALSDLRLPLNALRLLSCLTEELR